jgi:hypothetical protein
MTQPPVSCFLADFLFVEPMVDVQSSSGILHRVKAGSKQNVTRELVDTLDFHTDFERVKR